MWGADYLRFSIEHIFLSKIPYSKTALFGSAESFVNGYVVNYVTKLLLIEDFSIDVNWYMLIINK